MFRLGIAKIRLGYIQNWILITMATLEIKDLCVSREGKEILKGVNLKTGPGEVHAIMVPTAQEKAL